jgi:hypothetical protein
MEGEKEIMKIWICTLAPGQRLGAIVGDQIVDHAHGLEFSM